MPLTPPTRADVAARVKSLISDQLSLGLIAIENEETTFLSLDIDSLDSIELIMGIEDEFGIEIDDDKEQLLLNVKDLIDHVYELVLEDFE